MILIYLSAPKTDLNFYLFAAGLGFTWLATVAPTAAITGKLFGTRYLATLFGLTMLSHQIGGFFGFVHRRHRHNALQRLRLDVVRRRSLGRRGRPVEFTVFMNGKRLQPDAETLTFQGRLNVLSIPSDGLLFKNE